MHRGQRHRDLALRPGRSGNAHRPALSNYVHITMKVDLKDYVKIEIADGFQIYRHKKKDGFPKYWLKRANKFTESTQGGADKLEHARIFAKELDSKVFGMGPLSGYRRTALPPPEATYRRVIIGRYLFRDKSKDLPRFSAVVYPFAQEPRERGKPPKRQQLRLPIELSEQVSGFSVKEVKDKIDRRIESLPEKYHILFPKE